MDFNELLQIGARMIEQNDDPATSGLDTGAIADALGEVLGGQSGFDLSELVNRFAGGGLADIVASWIGSGDNAPLEPQKIGELFDGETIGRFAQQLGIDTQSAEKALADAIPVLVDKATPEGESLVGDLLAGLGGADGAMKMLGRLFG